ncbi:Transcriptional regulator, ArsR family [hydrothermal vent metagenome]|uniref:Transcriptional regulator, ArsR family n=1 Tax=hydrothermal vent metagenome TaxID=652676 RepID=A0A3B0XTK0_9ZZZZ
MPINNFKQDLFSQFARIGKALSNGNRLEILEFLAQGERSVDELSKVSGLTVGNTSQHLQQLRQSGLVKTRKSGLKVYYRITDNEVIKLMSLLRTVAESNLAEVDKLVSTYLITKDELEPICREELLSRVKEDLVTVIDVRPAEEFAAGHISGACNIPLADLEKRMEELDPDLEVIAYCRGPHCVLAFDAVARLRQQGLQVRRLEEGYPEWKLAGFPVELN